MIGTGNTRMSRTIVIISGCRNYSPPAGRVNRTQYKQEWRTGNGERDK
jgi:hypothetical protein